MPDFHTKSFPNSKYRFELYANIGKEHGETIAHRKGAMAWCNLGYFNIDTFQPMEGLVIHGKTLSAPRWHDWGVCIGDDGSMIPDLPDSDCGKLNFCAAVPPMIKHGKDAAARKDFDENGTTYIGFKDDGTPMISICPRKLPNQGATSQQAVQELVDKGCINVLRFDGSWSSQGNLGDGIIHGDKSRIVYSLLLIYERKKDTNAVTPAKTTHNVCLDAGHYTGCPNGNSDLDYKEDEFTLDMSKRLGRILERCGIRVYQTRKGDEYVGLTERSTFANSIENLDLFVSLHSNANPNKSCDGFGIYTYGPGIDKLRNTAAMNILRIAKASGITIWGNGLFYNDAFSVLRRTNAPAILIEHGFHSNTAECKLLKTTEYRERLAEIDAKGICETLGVEWIPDSELADVTPVHREGVAWCKENGITDGSRPKDAATREEVCTMIYRLQYKLK